MALINFIVIFVEKLLPEKLLKLSRNPAAPYLLSAGHMIIKLLNCQILMRVFWNGLHRLHNLYGSKKATVSRFDPVSFVSV